MRRSRTLHCAHLLLAGSVLLLVSAMGCSDVSDDLPPASTGGVKIHPTGWGDPDSPEFHGEYVESLDDGYSSCVTCHGAALNGGTSQVSCYGCHGTYPHSNGWSEAGEPDFHGGYLKANDWDADDCATCHGAGFDGGTSQVSCYSCHASYPHSTKPGWVSENASDFHGAYLKTKGWDVDECATCHGTQFDGGATEVSCFPCHDSFPHSAKFTGAGGYHPGYLQSKLYPLPACQSCHGPTYAGGTRVNVSCLTSGCHVDGSGTAKSPEACNTCHGVFSAPQSDLLSPAPPKSVTGATSPSDPRVGAHQAHLVAQVAKTLKCQECHAIPPAWNSPGHVNADMRAEVLFNDTLANTRTSNGTIIPAPAYNALTGRCSGTYCHGTFKNGNAGNAPVWSGVNQAACGTCHGTPSNPLPTAPHPRGAGSSDCATCHFTGSTPVVTYSSGVWTIVDAPRHVNGKVSIFGTEAQL